MVCQHTRMPCREHAWNDQLWAGHPNCGDPLAVVGDNYMRDILQHKHLGSAVPRDVAKMTYTAMHGTAQWACGSHFHVLHVCRRGLQVPQAGV